MARLRLRPTPCSRAAAIGVGLAGLLAGVALAGLSDPGADYVHLLADRSQPLFGFGHPLDAPVSGAFDGPGDEAVELAKGLEATLVTDRVGRRADMIALWPDDEHPTHSIICNEIDTASPTLGGGAPNPDFGKSTVQHVRLSDGLVTDMLTGLNACDPVRRTAWGTIVVGEENGATGRLWEILDPLAVAGVTVTRAAATSSDPAHVVARLALGQLSYEGIVLLPDGTTYYSDELRPQNSRPGGGLFKFVPTTPRASGDPITALDQSPLVAGRVSVMRLASPARNFNDFGQGTNTGAGRWQPLTTPANPVTFNLAAVALAAGGYTGHYRPEDMELDPDAWAAGHIRACFNDTGNDQANQWGETLCFTDTPTTEPAFPGGFMPVLEPFVIGNPELRMPDNLAFQPGTGNLYILMDATTSADGPAFTNDSLWACLPDGADPDILSDGCVRVMNVRDGLGEPTGIQFLADGRSFLMHLTHRTPDGRADPDTADQLLVTGLKVK
jgi:hypothetical protein